MKRLFTFAICALALTGCASQQQLDSVLHDIQGCKRMYQGGTGGAGLSAPSFTFSITCEPTAPAPAAVTPKTP